MGNGLTKLNRTSSSTKITHSTHSIQSKATTTTSDDKYNSILAQSRGVQDDARSYRSKTGAIKLLLRNEYSKEAFIKHLSTFHQAELLHCYLNLYEINFIQTENETYTRVSALVWKYKTELQDAMLTQQLQDISQSLPSRNNSILTIWECLGQLRFIATTSSDPTHQQLLKLVRIAENDLMSKLMEYFESFLESELYRDWQRNSQMKENRRLIKSSSSSDQFYSKTSTILPIVCKHHQDDHIQIDQRTPDPPLLLYDDSNLLYSNILPKKPSIENILIVDDSMVTLKLIGLSLERDAKSIDVAMNGQIALNMMKQRNYDVVLIDLSMPVLDGFETVRMFREYEKQNSTTNGSITDMMNMSGANDHNDDNISEISEDSVDLTNGDKLATFLSCNKQLISTDSVKKLSIADEISNSQGELYSLSSSVNQKYLSLTRKLHTHRLIIGISSNAEESTMKRAIHSGMDYFLTKPFTLEKFMETIRKSQTNDLKK